MKARAVHRRARAKINLTLHVTAQRADGYHLLDSLVAFADVGDDIAISPAQDVSLIVDGPLRTGVPTDDRNLVLKAAALFESTQGAQIRLTKNLPNAAGIGGGSADAAAALLSLAELWDAPLPDNLIQLGADVPVCMSPMSVRMRGVGEDISPVPPLPPLWAVLVNPRVAVETPPVFKALATKDNPPMMHIPECASAAEFIDWCKDQRNDLQAPAIALEPIIRDVLDALSSTRLARMSGSGATCFGLCESAKQADKIAKSISKAHPEWWVVSTTLS